MLTLVILAFALAANAQISPFSVSNFHLHRALAARVPAPELAAAVFPLAARKVQSGGRCRGKSTGAPSVNAAPTPPTQGGGGSMSGDGTTYGIGMGSCGVFNSGDDRIIAVSHELFDSYPGYDGVNPNNNPVCGKQIQAFYNGRSVIAPVRDRCENCSYSSLDFSPAAFTDLTNGNVGLGRVPITWNFVNQ